MRIKELRKQLKGWTQADLAEATDISRSYIAAIESENISKSPSAETLGKIASVLGVRIGDIFADSKSIPVCGKVGAGSRVPLLDETQEGHGLYNVACPSQLLYDQVAAVEIEGGSMLPTYKAGDILFFTRSSIGVPAEAIGSICICEDDKGFAWVKHIKASSGEGKFHLISINPTSDTMYDITLKWAAPVRLHWPRDLVERVQQETN